MRYVTPATFECLPGGHALQPVTSFTPMAEEYVPLAQLVHSEAALRPVLSLHKPARQPRHSFLSFLAYIPTGQLSHEEPGVELNLPLLQPPHVSDPKTPVNSFPGSHCKQPVLPLSGW